MIWILGICPGDKVPSAANELWCTCSSDAIEAADHKCIVCTVDEEVPNEDQTECVGMLDYCLSTKQFYFMPTYVQGLRVSWWFDMTNWFYNSILF